MKVAVFQPPYPAESAARECFSWMEQELARLQPGGQDLVLLPEYANAPGLHDRASILNCARNQGADFLRAITISAQRLNCLIAVNGVIESVVHWFNRTMVIDAAGETVFNYDKIHLTNAEKDDLGLTPGAELRIFEHDGIRMGFATCFDLYFPEQFESIAVEKADLILCPSYQRSETAERIRLIARARALDSGAYIIRSSYSMETPDKGGRSLIAAPTGEVLADAGSEPGIITAEFDPSARFVKPASHGKDPVDHRTLIESHRRPSLYRVHSEHSRAIAQSPFPRLCAHRGLSQACPENTIPAFAAAMAAGAHEIEFDLQTSRDGILVVCHDRTVDRTTNGTGAIAELSWEKIRSLDAGVRTGDAWRGIRMPRFEEILDLTDGRVGLNIHISGAGPEGTIVKRVCDLLNERALLRSAYVALDTEQALQTAIEYSPAVALACLVCQDEPTLMIQAAERYGCQRVQFLRGVSRDEISKAHEAGLICNLFYSDEPDDAMRFVEQGINVILTNCTHIMVEGGFEPLR